MLAPTDYEITEAENGEQALTAIAKQRPDLIPMDAELFQRARSQRSALAYVYFENEPGGFNTTAMSAA